MERVDSTPAAPSTRPKMRFAFNQVQSFRERDTLKDAEPFARIPVVGQVETVPADVFEACEGRLEWPVRTGSSDRKRVMKRYLLPSHFP